jgi:hypothetical protein
MAAVNVPSLDIDKLLHPDGRIGERGRIERRVVAKLIAHLDAAGFVPIQLDGYDEGPEFIDRGLDLDGRTKATMELVFNLDDSWISFLRTESDEPTIIGSVQIVLGNGSDCISNWTIRSKSFDKAMNAFLTILDKEEG